MLFSAAAKTIFWPICPASKYEKGNALYQYLTSEREITDVNTIVAAGFFIFVPQILYFHNEKIFYLQANSEPSRTE